MSGNGNRTPRSAAGGGRLAGQSVLITGSGSGLGRESALLFAAEGASYEEMQPWDPASTSIPLKLARPPSLRDNAYAALFHDEAIQHRVGCEVPRAGGNVGVAGDAVAAGCIQRGLGPLLAVLGSS